MVDTKLLSHEPVSCRLSVACSMSKHGNVENPNPNHTMYGRLRVLKQSNWRDVPGCTKRTNRKIVQDPKQQTKINDNIM
jgi:hypothetical protein